MKRVGTVLVLIIGFALGAVATRYYDTRMAAPKVAQAPPAAAARPLRIPSYTALKATGFTDPDRARQNLRLVLEGRPLIPYPAAAGRAVAHAGGQPGPDRRTA